MFICNWMTWWEGAYGVAVGVSSSCARPNPLNESIESEKSAFMQYASIIQKAELLISGKTLGKLSQPAMKGKRSMEHLDRIKNCFRWIQTFLSKSRCCHSSMECCKDLAVYYGFYYAGVTVEGEKRQNEYTEEERLHKNLNRDGYIYMYQNH